MHDPFVIGDRVRFHAEGIPGPMIGDIVDIDMGYAIIMGPDGRSYMRCVREIEDAKKVQRL